jgi:hypothetical protein
MSSNPDQIPLLFPTSFFSDFYGYRYFYNPHRPLGMSEEYHLRTIERFKFAIGDRGSRLNFVLADYPDCKGSRFLDRLCEHNQLLQSTIANHCCASFRIWALRISHSGDQLSMPSVEYRISRSFCEARLTLSPSNIREHDEAIGHINAVYARFFLRALIVNDKLPYLTPTGRLDDSTVD